MTDTPDLIKHLRNEQAARKPWLYAEGESWWVVSGTVGPKNVFTNCLARVVPSYITGVDDDGTKEALFEVLVWGGSHLVGAAQILRARRLVFVLADEPTRAYYVAEQEFIDA